jgi:hypothetical protein
MTISKYNTIRFILDEAYEDHKALGKDWDEWLRKISRMFNYNVPEALIEGLQRKDPSLKITNNPSMYVEASENKYTKWIERRDRGNQRRIEEMKVKKEQEVKFIEEQRIKWLEDYENKMKPKWDSDFNKFITNREKQMREK